MEYRKSLMELNQIYFYTATIYKWKKLLTDEFKKIIIDALLFLKAKELIVVYGYVIMPNHLHLLWKMKKLNGKEKPNASFLKFTAHEFKKRSGGSAFSLSDFRVNAPNKAFEFWQRDSLATAVFTQKVIEQKLNYIHYNPLQSHWALCQYPEEYAFSSAAFYSSGYDAFGLVTHINEVL